MNPNAYSPQIIIGACAAVVVVFLIITWGVIRQSRRRRTAALRIKFGPEYDLALREYGSRRKAETVLMARLRRVDQLEVRQLTEIEVSRYLSEWESVQARFVDHPRAAVIEADEMINAVLLTCGYPTSKSEQRSADLSVHHARLVEPYRRANAITARAGKNEATTEELRTAMILYRALLEELMQVKAVPLSRAA